MANGCRPTPGSRRTPSGACREVGVEYARDGGRERCHGAGPCAAYPDPVRRMDLGKGLGVGDGTAVIVLSGLLVLFIVYRVFKRRVDRKLKPWEWMTDVVAGLSLVVFNSVHLYIVLTQFDTVVTAAWVFGRVVNCIMILAGGFIAIRAAVRRKSFVNIRPG